MVRKKCLKVILIVLGCLIALYLCVGLINYLCNLSLRRYIDSFPVPDYGEERLVPVKDGDYYTYVTDGDLNIMHVTDVHIGGGFWTYKTDKKTIYELMTMVYEEKPDLVILGGDNTYAVPGPVWNGGFTLNNKMAARTLVEVFEHEKVYFSTVFGNHDTECADYYSRSDMGEFYASDELEYSIFESQFSDPGEEPVPSVSNQFILIKGTDGKIRKLILLLDTNAYTTMGIASTVKQQYDTIHEQQIEWAAGVIKELSAEEGLPEGEYLKTLVFLHIPTGEYRAALDDLIDESEDAEGNKVYTVRDDPVNTEYVSGFWGEQYVCFGGFPDRTASPENNDRLFEVLADEMHSMEAMFCGHDHANNAVVYYKGVMLSYGYSLDNTAYGRKIKYSGLQRGDEIITVKADGTFSDTHKNAYTDYGCSTDMFYDVYLDRWMYPEYYRTVE